MAARGWRKLYRMLGLRRPPAWAGARDLGDRARDRRDWHTAAEHYRTYLVHQPDSFAIWVQFGHANKESGDPVGAEQAYLRALALNEGDADLLLNLGHFMKGQGRVDEAMAYYARATFSDTTGSARAELADLQAVTARAEEAAAQFPVRIGDREPSPYVKGVIDVTAAGAAPIAVRLLENGQEIATAPAEGDGRHRRFAIRLPAHVCDGRPHAFEIAAGSDTIAHRIVVTPAFLTPPAILGDYLDRPMRGRLSIGAEWRYAALAEWTERAGEAIPGRPDPATLAAAHRFLVDGPMRAGLDDAYAPLHFPGCDTPEVSVVIPVHNNFRFTYRCLASLLVMPTRRRFEVILVDDGSSDRTVGIAELVSGIHVVRHETAQGFVGACNAGGAAARGDFVLLLNNDTEVSPHWLDRLVEPFDLYDDVGLVGAKLIYGDGRLQEAGGVFRSDGRASNHGRFGNIRDPRYNYLRETDYCSGACIILRRTEWDALGGFDPIYAPAYYEDTDLAFRLSARGLRVLYQPLAEIFHFEGVSNGTDIETGMKRFQRINEPKFRERWDAVVQQRIEAQKSRTAIERTYPCSVLVIDTEVPQPDRSAGHHAAVQEIRLLQSLGYRVTFLPTNLAWLGRYNDYLARLGVETIYAPFCLGIDEFLSQRGDEFDLVYITRYSVATEMLPRLAIWRPDLPVVFNNADLHFLRVLRDAIESDDAAMLHDAERIRDAELEVMRAVTLTLSYNPVEHAVIQTHTLGAAKVALCPWVVERRPAGPAFAAREGIAFLGGYRHPPNRRAVEYFVREVMPLLRTRRPGIRFHIYGSYVPPEFADYAADDVIIHGFVDRVEEALDNARVFVAPLRSGAGIKGKVLEALASGVPSVLSPIAAEGTGVRAGLEAFVAEDPMQWVEAIVRLHDDAAAWQAMADAARTFVFDAYSFERARETLRTGLETHGIPTSHGWTSRTLPAIE